MFQCNNEILDSLVNFPTNDMKVFDVDSFYCIDDAESIKNIEEDLNVEDLCEWLKEEDDSDSVDEEAFLTMCSFLESPPLEAVISNLQMSVRYNNMNINNTTSCTTTGTRRNNNYNNGIDEGLEKLQASMRRTELSRIEVLHPKNRITPNETTAQTVAPHSSSLTHLNNFFTGKRKSLTTELEESRKQLRFINAVNVNYRALTA